MIYVDTSVVLAHVLSEDRRPPSTLWDELLVSSQLTRYETWIRLNAAGLGETHGVLADGVLGRLRLASLNDEVLVRALEPFPLPVRSLDAMHLATIAFLGQMGQIRLATYDTRMMAAARAMDITLLPL